jgi:hypothetical protein
MTTAATFPKAIALFLVLPLASFGASALAQEPDDELVEQREIDPEEIEPDYALIEDILEAEEEILAGGGFTYDAGGRRDPFMSLLLRTELRSVAEPRPEGVPGLLIDELSIRGIFALSEGRFAQVQTADRTTSYLISEGAQLFDGEVLRIGPNEVVFRQIVHDPTIIKPFREVVKKLNPEP